MHLYPTLIGFTCIISPLIMPDFHKRLYRFLTAPTEILHFSAISVKLVRDSIKRVFKIFASVTSIVVRFRNSLPFFEILISKRIRILNLFYPVFVPLLLEEVQFLSFLLL